MGDPGSIPGSGRFPWRRKWQPTPVLSTWKIPWMGSLVGYSPWGHKESDMTERLHFAPYCKVSYLPQNVIPVPHHWELIYSFFYMCIIHMCIFFSLPQHSNAYVWLCCISPGCHNNIPQTRWLRPTETYCLSVLEARSPKSRCWLGHAPSEGCREGSVSASILALIASGGSFAYRYIIPNLHLYIFPLCLYITFPLGMSLYPNVPFQ